MLQLETLSQAGAAAAAVLCPVHLCGPLQDSPLVLLDVMQVVAAHDDGAGHLGALHLTSQDAAADGHIAGEGALMVNVVACRPGTACSS